MKLLIHVLASILYLLLILSLFRSYFVFFVASDYSLLLCIKTLFIGGMYDLTMLLTLHIPFFLILAVCLYVEVEAKRYMHTGLSIMYLICISLLSAFVFFNYSSWHLLDRPLDLAVINGLEQQGIGNLIADALVLFLWQILFVIMLVISLSVLYLFIIRVSIDKLKLERLFNKKMIAVPILVIGPFVFLRVSVYFGYYEQLRYDEIGHRHLSAMAYDPVSQWKFSQVNLASGYDPYFKSLLADDSFEDCVVAVFGKDMPDNIDGFYAKTFSESDVFVKKPSHIFIIIVESYSSWALTGTYAVSNLCPGFQRLRKGGHCWLNVLMAGNQTKDSVIAMLTGMPYVKDSPLYYGGMQTSNVRQLQNISYTVDFYSSSFHEWGYLHKLSDALGVSRYKAYRKEFDGKEFDTTKMNHWGIYDEYFYQYVAEDVRTEEQTVSVLLTSGNHVPFTIPVEHMGFNSDTLHKLPNYQPASLSEQRLSHMWYADKCLEDFVQTMHKKFPDSLFVITGDHCSREPPVKDLPVQYHEYVPLLLYGPNIFKQTNVTHEHVITQMDILPSVLNACALNKKREASSIGFDIFKPNEYGLGIGFNGVFTDGEHVFKWNGGDSAGLLNGQGQSSQFAGVTTDYRRRMAILWHRCVYGRSWKNNWDVARMYPSSDND